MTKRTGLINVFLLAFIFCYSKEKYDVGFQYFKTADQSREYFLKEDTVSRPILIHFWYPCQTDSQSKQMTFKDYIDLIAIREKFDKKQAKIDAQSIKFINAYLGFSKRKFGIDATLTTKKVLNSPVKAIFNATPIHKKFPLVIYAPSNSKSVVQNHLLCEYLASNGYFVLSVGSAGEKMLKRKDDKKATLAQAKDMNFLIYFMQDSLRIKYSGIGLLGYSSGSMATAIFQMQHPEVKSIVSLDGGNEYSSYLNLFQLADFDLQKATKPYLLFCNNFDDFSIYPYYSTIVSTNKSLYKMSSLNHNGFVSFWKQFDICSYQKSNNKAIASYDILCQTTTDFFDSTLKSDSKSFNISDNNLIQKNTVDFSTVSLLLNHILKDGIDNGISEIKAHKTLYKEKDKQINILARMFMGSDNQTAIKILTANTEINPESWESYYNLSYLYKESNDTDAAKAAIQKAKNIDKENKNIDELYEKILKNEEK